jgi:hypothetical protein
MRHGEQRLGEEERAERKHSSIESEWVQKARSCGGLICTDDLEWGRSTMQSVPTKTVSEQGLTPNDDVAKDGNAERRQML